MSTLNSLYQLDFNLWLEKNLALLKERGFAQLDIDNLVEEMEDMGNNRKDALESNLMRVF